jgi:hypothetical protein
MHLGLRRTSTFAPGLHALMLTSALLASSLLAVAAPSAANEVVPERTDSELRVEQRIAQHLSAHRAGHDLATLPRHHELDHYMRAWADHTADDVCDAYDSVYECIIDQAHLDAPEDVTGDTAVLQILPTVATDELSDGQLDQIADLAFSGLSSGHPLKASDGPTTAGIGVAHRTYVGSDAATYHNVIIYVVDGHHDEIVDGEVSAAPKPDELAPPADDEPIFAEPDHSHDCPDGAELPAAATGTTRTPTPTNRSSPTPASGTMTSATAGSATSTRPASSGRRQRAWPTAASPPATPTAPSVQAVP